MASPNLQLSLFGAKPETGGTTVLIPLRGKHGRGKCLTVDAVDADLLSRKWTAQGGGYASCTVRRDRINRLVCERAHGPAPSSEHEADHINGDPLDNRRANLRWSSRRQNLRNRRFRTSRRYRGLNRLRYADGTPFFQPALYIDGRQVHLGSYPDEETAARVYDAYASVYYGAFAVLNYPGDDPWTLDECERVRGSVARQATWARPAHERLDEMLASRGLPPRSPFP